MRGPVVGVHGVGHGHARGDRRVVGMVRKKHAALTHRDALVQRRRAFFGREDGDHAGVVQHGQAGGQHHQHIGHRQRQ